MSNSESIETSGGEARILVIDDEELLRDLLSAVLSYTGWTVETAESAEQALKMLAGEAFDMFIVDKNLPGMGGVTLIEKIREADRVAGILMLTGYGSVDSALRVLELGIDGYFEKPFENSRLVERVEAILRRANQRRRIQRNLSEARSSVQELLHTRSAPDKGKALKALVLSQQPDKRARMMGLLQSLVASVDELHSSEELLPRLRSGTFDLVVAEALPNQPDIEHILEELRRRHSNVACIVATQQPRLDQVQKFISMGVKGVVQWSLEDDHIKATLQRVLGQVRLSRPEL